MKCMISAFAIEKRDGAGWVSKSIMEREKFHKIKARKDTILAKCLWASFGLVAFPFLHPIFCRYTPIFSRLLRFEGDLWLNFSQTFALGILNRKTVMVCHDLQCHCDRRFKSWVRWSERFLLNRAKGVVVLSQRDEKIVSRYYNVPRERVQNIFSLLAPTLHSFHRTFPDRITRVAFLGTLAREENRKGLAWFVREVLPACPWLEVSVIGEVVPKFHIDHPRLHFVGFIDNLKETMANQELMIAPMFSRAGIKIKVLEALLAETPVLGTRAAYGGLRRPAGGWCSDDPRDWIRILNMGVDYAFPGL